MLHWISATALGIALGLVLYGCVRLRMHYAPILKKRYGNWARESCWVAAVLAMIFSANAALMVLRAFLSAERAADDMLMLEIWFAVIALAVALKLIFMRMNRTQ